MSCTPTYQIIMLTEINKHDMVTLFKTEIYYKVVSITCQDLASREELNQRSIWRLTMANWRHGKATSSYRHVIVSNRRSTHLLATRKPSCGWQTRATPAKSFHGLRKSSGVVVACIASLLIDSVSMVYYYILYSNCVCKMRRFGDTRLLKLPWPWNPGQGSHKVIESDTIR